MVRRLSSKKFSPLPKLTTKTLVSAMEEYTSPITMGRLTQAWKQLKQLREGTSKARSLTAAETYAGLLQRRLQQEHEQHIKELERIGKEHGV